MRVKKSAVLKARPDGPLLLANQGKATYNRNVF
jgi:hypothetical protein